MLSLSLPISAPFCVAPAVRDCRMMTPDSSGRGADPKQQTSAANGARSGEAVDRGNDARPAGHSERPDSRSPDEAWVGLMDRWARLSGRVADRPDVRGDLAADQG